MRVRSWLRSLRPSAVITTWEGLDALAADWDRLWRGDPRARRLCYAYGWVRGLLDHHGWTAKTRPWCVILRDPSGRVRGIAPLVRELGAPRRVRSLPDLVERNHCFLHEADALTPLARAVVRQLDLHRMHGLRLRGVLRGPALETARAWSSAGWRCAAQRISEAEGSGVAGTTWWDRRAIAIEGTWPEYLQARGGNYRSSLKRATKRLAQAGAVRFWRHSAGRQLCGDPLSNQELLTALRAIESHAWQAERHFAPEGDGAAMLEVLRAQGLLELSLLYLDERPVSYLFGHAAGRAATIKQLGYDPALQELSPGVVSLAELVRTTFAEGHLDEINLRGSEHRYKAQLADVVESAFVLELAGLTPRGLASFLVRRRAGHRASGRALLGALDRPEPVAAPGTGVTERTRVDPQP